MIKPIHLYTYKKRNIAAKFSHVDSITTMSRLTTVFIFTAHYVQHHYK